MINIGVIGGGNNAQIIMLLESLSSLCFLAEEAFFADYLSREFKSPKMYDILIINTPSLLISKYLDFIVPNCILFVNSDEKEISSCIGNIQCKIITYGLNSKACITASSVEDGIYKTVLCCLLRIMPTYSNKQIMQQEFAVKVKNTDINVHCILASVAVAITCDIPIENIVDTLL